MPAIKSESQGLVLEEPQLLQYIAFKKEFNENMKRKGPEKKSQRIHPDADFLDMINNEQPVVNQPFSDSVNKTEPATYSNNIFLINPGVHADINKSSVDCGGDSSDLEKVEFTFLCYYC